VSLTTRVRLEDATTLSLSFRSPDDFRAMVVDCALQALAAGATHVAADLRDAYDDLPREMVAEGLAAGVAEATLLGVRVELGLSAIFASDAADRAA
jgi:hypothetical protein